MSVPAGQRRQVMMFEVMAAFVATMGGLSALFVAAERFIPQSAVVIA